MKKTVMAMLIFPAILTGCATGTFGNNSSLDITEMNMQHHNWILESVDGKALELPEGFTAPNLEIGEAFTANGHSGCNRYFGQASLKDDQFRIDKMATTMMACPEPAMSLEGIMTNVLGNWSSVELGKQYLVLTNNEYTLRFRLSDWMN